MDFSKISQSVDLCLLTPDCSLQDIETLCNEAAEQKFRSVCIPPIYIPSAVKLLEGTSVKISTVIGCPYGYAAIESKLAETILALVSGAHEIELMINLVALKNADWQYLARELNAMLPVIRKQHASLTVIFETGMFNTDELKTACDLYGVAGVDTVKTATGCLSSITTVESVQMIRKYLADSVLINAQISLIDGIDIQHFLNAGAGRISLNYLDFKRQQIA